MDDEESVSNSDDDIRRLKGVTEKDIARMTKYHQMSMRLTLKLQDEPGSMNHDDVANYLLGLETIYGIWYMV